MRSMLRHERQTVRMALAAALHHSAGPKEKVELQQNAAQRGQMTGARAREGEVHEKNDAPRRQNAPHLGERPGILVEPGPQRSDRSLWHSSGDGLTLLTTPSLASSVSEAVDASALAFLPLSVAGDEGAGGAGEERGGGEAWRQGDEGRVLGLVRPPSAPLTSAVEEDDGARDGAGRHGGGSTS